MTENVAQAWDPALYDRAARFVPKLGGDLLELLAPKAGERVLDLGCGTGDLTLRLAEAGGSVVGVDSSREMIREARRKHPALDLRVADGQSLEFEQEFDAVFSNAALHWMPRADDVASGIRRALRPGGRFVAELGGARCVASVRAAVQDCLLELGEKGAGTPSWYFPTLTQYASCLERAGLLGRSLLWFERPTPLPGPDGLATWLELFCTELLKELGSKREAFLRGVARRCEPQLYRDGAWWLDYTRLRVVAERPLTAE